MSRKRQRTPVQSQENAFHSMETAWEKNFSSCLKNSLLEVVYEAFSYISEFLNKLIMKDNFSHSKVLSRGNYA